MTQRTTFTRDMIVEAAFALTRELGWGGVTARTIAQKLGSSTMPIYSSLKSMEEIEGEVRKKAEALMHEYQRRPFTGEKLLSSAVGYVAFARDEPKLFRFLYVDRPLTQLPQERTQQAEGGPADIESVGGVVDLANQAATALGDPTVLRSWAFTHGLASLISSKVIDLPDERISALIMEAGTAFYLLADLQKKLKEGGRNE
jgi:AcrR family transcriptional regulator